LTIPVRFFERHHAQKDAPSGTASRFQKMLRESAGGMEVVSFREGDVVGMHEVVFNSKAINLPLPRRQVSAWFR
jgi:dihydrodipicolinate reductase